jgi:hypothetical protein
MGSPPFTFCEAPVKVAPGASWMQVVLALRPATLRTAALGTTTFGAVTLGTTTLGTFGAAVAVMTQTYATGGNPLFQFLEFEV